MSHSITSNFFIRTSGLSQEKKVAIYLRISVNGHRIEQSINRSIERANWSASNSRLKGTSAEAKLLNNHLDAINNKVYIFEREMILDRIEITYKTFRNKWFGIGREKQMILEIFREHNENVTLLLGKDFAPGTLQRYKTSFLHTKNFIEFKYKVADLEVTNIDYAFISNYALWLKTVRNCNHNSTMKYLGNFKKIVLICLKNGWISKDPFLSFKLSKHEVEKPILTEQELERITGKQFDTERLNYVKDIFIFSCYTGLAYADVKKLKRSDIIIGVDGLKWISIKRQKTDTPSRIPILHAAENLINKYSTNKQCIIKDCVLPVLSNQKMNSYLKEIADTCGIEKNLTFHIARHTFATTITLGNGVPIETVSKMLGHTNLRTTQHYAKIIDFKVSDDMIALKKKLSDKLDIKNNII